MTQSNQWQPVILVLIEIVISYLLFVIGLCVFQLELGCPGGYFSGCWRIIRSDKSYFSPTDIDQWDAWKQTLRTIQAGSYLIVYHFLLFMLLWSYYKIITTKSYFKNPEIYDSLALEESQPNETEEKEEQEENIEEDDPRLLYGHVQQKPKLFFANEPTFCQSCKVHRPPRARHCSMCKRCVLKFDHHCPWVNNCVGFTNYKFFILFLFYGSLFSLYLFVTLSSKYAFVGWTVCLSSVFFFFFYANLFLGAQYDRNSYSNRNCSLLCQWILCFFHVPCSFTIFAEKCDHLRGK